MRKFFLAVAAMVMLATSCTKDETAPMGNESLVSFSISSPELATRADKEDGKGLNTNSLQYAFYDENGQILTALTGTIDNFVGSTKINISLVEGREYSALFWADNTAAPYHVDLAGKTMTITEDEFVGNADKYDAFYKYQTEINPAQKTHHIELTRPFAQINIATADKATAANAGFTAAATQVTVTAHSTLNLATGVVGDNDYVEYTYTWANLPTNPATATVGGTSYEMLAMNYVLVNDKELVNVKMEVSEETVSESATYADAIERNYTTVPVQRNYRTYIVGNLLTTNNEFNVETKPEWEKDPENDKVYYVWDGSEVKEPKVSNNIYEIEYASELAWLAAAVNGTLTEDYTRSTVAANDFAGKTFKLIKDIDLGGKEWTPIGSSSNPFKGTFDGSDYEGKVKTVKNLVITGNNSNVGLFGHTQDGEIKNLVVENAKVSGRTNVGVVAGQPYTSKYTNITVQGHVEVNGMAYVGGVGGKNAYADWTNITVNADDTSYVKANSVENGTAYRTYVGGVVGFNGEGGHKFENITSNINVEGSTCDVGGLFGIAHYGNQFVNCVCTGDVEIYAAEEADEALEIGGIAGVWHNQTGETVTLTDCDFTGELYTNIEVDYHNGGLVGKPYSATDTGKLIINGKLYVASAAQLQAALDAATEGETTIYFGADIVAGVTEIQKLGRQVTIDGENHTYNGTIKVHSNSNYYDDAALTINNVNFETSTASINFIEALENGAERYSQNITVDNCTFKATGDAVNTAVGLQVKATRGVTVKNCKATNMHSLIQAQSCDTGDVKVVDCEINGKNGVAFKQVKSATVQGTTITATGYGIRFDGNTDNYGIVVKNNTVTAAQPLIVRRMTGKNNTIKLEGNTLTTEAEYQIVITNGEDDAEYVKPTGTYTLTGAEGYTVFPAAFPVASWDEFTAALAAGEDWIKLTADITYDASYTIKNDVTIDLNGKTLKITDPTKRINIGNKNDKNAPKPNVTIKNGNFHGKVYAQTGNMELYDIKFGGTIDYAGDAQGVITVGSANLLAERCDMAGVKAGASRPRALSTEGCSNGYLILRDCNFPSSSDGTGLLVKTKLQRTYINPLSLNAKLELTNCKFGVAANIDLAASYVWSNMDLNGCSGGFTFTVTRSKDSLTEEETAIMKDIKKNNGGTIKAYYNGILVTY